MAACLRILAFFIFACAVLQGSLMLAVANELPPFVFSSSDFPATVESSQGAGFTLNANGPGADYRQTFIKVILASSSASEYEVCSKLIGAHLDSSASFSIRLTCKLPPKLAPGTYSLRPQLVKGTDTPTPFKWSGVSPTITVIIAPDSAASPKENPDADSTGTALGEFDSLVDLRIATDIAIPNEPIEPVDMYESCSAPYSSGNAQGPQAIILDDAAVSSGAPDSDFEPEFQKILVDVNEHSTPSGKAIYSQYSDAAKQASREIGVDWLHFAFKLTGARKGEIIGVYLKPTGSASDGKTIKLCNSHVVPFKDDNPNSKGFFWYRMKCQIPLRTKDAFAAGTNYHIFVQLETPSCGPVVRNGAPSRFWGKTDESYYVALTGRGSVPKPQEKLVPPKAAVLPKPIKVDGKPNLKPPATEAVSDTLGIARAWLTGKYDPEFFKVEEPQPSGDFKTFYIRYSLQETRSGTVVDLEKNQEGIVKGIEDLGLSKIWFYTYLPWRKNSVKITKLQLVLVDNNGQKFFSNELSVPQGTLYSESNCINSPLKLVYTHPVTKKEYGLRFCALIDSDLTLTAFNPIYKVTNSQRWLEKWFGLSRYPKMVISLVFSKLDSGVSTPSGAVSMSYRRGGLDSKNPDLRVSVQLVTSMETPFIGFNFGALENCITKSEPVPSSSPFQYSLSLSLKDVLCNACDVPATVSASSQDLSKKASTTFSVPCKAKILAVTALDLNDPQLRESVEKLVNSLPDSTRVISLGSKESLKYYSLANLAVGPQDTASEKANKYSLAISALLEKTGARRLLIIGDESSLPQGKANFYGKEVISDAAFAGLDENGDPKIPVLRIEGGAGNDAADSTLLVQEMDLVSSVLSTSSSLNGGSPLT